MKRFAIVCESVTGNTKKLAQTLQSYFRAEKAVLMTPAQADADTYDVLLVGSWTEKGDCAAQTAVFLESLRDKKIFLFGTCGFGGTTVYFDTVYRRFAAHLKPSNQIIGHFFCQGKMPESVLHRYEAMKEANPDSTRWHESIANYHQALNHPNEQDCHALCRAVKQALEGL